MATLRRLWAADDPELDQVQRPRDDLVREQPTGPGRFEQAHGPFTRYERRLDPDPSGGVLETVSYRVRVPWFGWLFLPLVRLTERRRHPGVAPGHQPWWAPRDRLDERQVAVLGLMAAASLVAAFVNTLFTQTVNFAADEFGVGNGAQGIAGTVVRFGILAVAPLAFVADRLGRRTVIVGCALAAPLLASVGAIAPSFVTLTATQTVARPIGLVLELLIGVVVAEEMPRNSRAYAVSLTALAGGLGSGLCVMALTLADLGPTAWRLVYVLSLVWVVVAWDLWRRLPETHRFEAHRSHGPDAAQTSAELEAEATAAAELRRQHLRRLALLATVAFVGNLFVAPASFFQNRYLDDVRGYSAGGISLFTLVTTTPVGIGVLVGGRLADKTGRRVLGATTLVVGTTAFVISFGTAGAAMWLSAVTGSIVLGATVPALGVYRTELFATGSRSMSSYLITTSALVGGSIGLLWTGHALDGGRTHFSVLGLLALGQVAVAVIVLTRFPETAHKELEELNPQDAVDYIAPPAEGEDDPGIRPDPPATP
ncbi:MAG: MFS transporter [Ilumatobacteraceae bacterium]